MKTSRSSARVNVRVVAIFALVCGLLFAGVVVGHRVRSRAMARDALAKGLAAFDQQDWPVACKHLRHYLSKFPDDIKVLQQFASAHLARQPLEPPNIANATAAYRRILRVNPEEETAYAWLARLYEATRNAADLTYIAQEWHKRAAEDPRPGLWLAKASVLRGDPEAAREAYLGVISAMENTEQGQKEYVDACLGLAQIALENAADKPPDEALDWLNRAVDHKAQSPSAEALVARAQWYRAHAVPPDLDLARQDLEKAQQVETSNPKVHLMLGQEWLEHGEPQRARDELRKARNTDPDAVKQYFLDPDDLLVLWFDLQASLVLRAGTREECVALADEVLAPEDPPQAMISHTPHRINTLPSGVSLYLHGAALDQGVIDEENLAKAEACLSELLDLTAGIKLPPERDDQITLMRARVAYVRQQPHTVIEVLEPLVARNPELPAAWRLLVDAFNATRQPGRAMRALRELDLLPLADAQAVSQVASELLRRGDWERALATSRRAIAMGASDLNTLLVRLEATIESIARHAAPDPGRVSSVQEELNALRQSVPREVRIRQLQAALAALLGDVTRAEQELRQARDECDDTLPAELLLVRLYVTTGQLDKANEAARTACERYAEEAASWLTLSAVCRASGHLPDARQALATGLEAASEGQNQRLLATELALFDLVHGDRQAGIDRLKQMAADDPEDEQVRALLLSLSEIRDDATYAQQIVEELRAIEGKSGLRWKLYQAMLWLRSPEWREHQHEIDEFLSYCAATDPLWSAPVLQLGDLYERLERWDDARELYRRSLRENPDALGIACRLVEVLERNGQFAEAKEALEQINAMPSAFAAGNILGPQGAEDAPRPIRPLELTAAADPDYAISRILLARLTYREQKDAEAALRYLDEAQALLPKSIVPHSVRVSVLRAEGRLDEARALLDGLVGNAADAKRKFDAFFLRAMFLTGIGEADKAEQDYVELMHLDNDGLGYELLGQFYWDGDRLDEAIATLEAGCEAHADNTRLQRELAKALLTSQQEDERQRGEARLSELLAHLPDDVDLLWTQVLVAMNKGGVDALQDAERLCRKIIATEPAHIDAHLALAHIAMQRKDPAAALEITRAARQHVPDDPRLLLAEAEVHLDVHRPRQAWRLAREAWALADPSADGSQRANVERTLVKAALTTTSPTTDVLETTRRLLSEALAETPANVPLLLDLCRILNALGQTDVAITRLEEFRESPDTEDTIDVLLMLANLNGARGNVEASGRWIEAAADLEPDNLAVLRARMAYLGACGKFDEITSVVLDAQGLPRRDLGHREFMVAASALAASPEHRSKAAELFHHVTSVAPGLAEAYSSLALLAYEDGDLAAAAAVYRDLLKHDPNNTRALNDLAWILAKGFGGDTQQLEQALTLANQAVTQDPDNVHFLDTRSYVYIQLGQLAEARGDLERCVQLSADRGRRAAALRKLAGICEQLGEAEAAEQHRSQATQLDQP